MRRKIVVILFIMLGSMILAQDITGEWNGLLSVQNTSLRIVFHVSKTDNGYAATMDSPDQGAKGLVMSHVMFKDSMLTIELRIAGMSYTGKLGTANTLTGTFTQAGQSIPLNLTKNLEAVVSTANGTSVELNASYVETPMILTTKTGQIFGTLTTPKIFKKGQVALIIAGSGPTDRNGNNPSMTNDAYKKLAYALAENNLASLRYDKRGIAQSAAAVERESDLVFDDYVRDASAWVDLLKKDTRFTHVVVIGHSEGSLIGMLAAGKADKYISIAGPGRRASDLLKEQLTAQGGEEIRTAFPIIDSLVQGKTVSVVDPTLASLFRASVQPYLISWFKYEPQVALKQLKVPVLLIQGTNDIQVTVEDAKRLSIAKPSAQLLLIDKMNHILRTSEIDRDANLATYNNVELPLASGLSKAIVAFILTK